MIQKMSPASPTSMAPGRLEVFLGVVPGIGTTAEMLRAALVRQRDGAQVVLGTDEALGHQELQQFIGEIPAVPNRQIEHDGRFLEEMDVDEIVLRKPKLVLIEDMAHINAPGSRHPRRYIDIKELLAAGIDVYATINVENIESLSDPVAQITGVRVYETVPDSIVDLADQISFVDTTAEDIFQQWSGKGHTQYFRPGNLTALRTLAIRRTTQHVRGRTIAPSSSGIAADSLLSGEHILVCVSERPGCASDVRYARRLADRQHSKWTALYVESLRHFRLREDEKARIAECLRLAERLGGDSITIPGGEIVDEILTYGREHNVTQIVIGKSRRSRWFEMLHGSVVDDLVRRAGGISVHVIAGEDESKPTVTSKSAIRRTKFKDVIPPTLTISIVAIVTLFGVSIREYVDMGGVTLLYITTVLITAVVLGLTSSLLASVISVVCIDFFFQPPIYEFRIADSRDVVALIFFAITAFVASGITYELRAQALLARNRAKITAGFYAFSRKLAGLARLEELLDATARQIGSMLRSRVVIFLHEDGKTTLRAVYPADSRVSEDDLQPVGWSFRNGVPSGRGTESFANSEWSFIPLRIGINTVGVLGVKQEVRDAFLTPDDRRLIDALADQASVAIQRIALADEIDRTRILRETEHLRDALLSSISHDLRTPLASILGSLTSLRSYQEIYDRDTKDGLLNTALEEAERLNRFVNNLLDITRLESGALEVKRDPIDIEDVVGSALKRARIILGDHKVNVDITSDLPMLRLDFVLFEQVLFNLLDNATKYSPPGSMISVTGMWDNDSVRLQIADEGPGIPDEHLEHIFDKFHRVKARDRQRAGTGLGLAICRGFVEAQGGTISASNRTDRSGAQFTITFPLSERSLATAA